MTEVVTDREAIRELSKMMIELIDINKSMAERITNLEEAAKLYNEVLQALLKKDIRKEESSIEGFHTCNGTNPTSTDVCPACLAERWIK